MPRPIIFVKIDTIAAAGLGDVSGNENIFALWLSAAEVSLSKAEAYFDGYGRGSRCQQSENSLRGRSKTLYSILLGHEGDKFHFTKQATTATEDFRPLVRPTDDITAYAESIWNRHRKLSAHNYG